MALSSDDFRNLALQIEDLNRAVRSNIEVTAKNADAVTSANRATERDRGSAALSASGGGGGSGSSFAGFGVSAARQVLAAGGPLGSAAAGVLSGFQSGGPLGALGSALGSTASIAATLGRARQQGELSAPLFSDAGSVARAGAFAETQAKLDLLNSFNAPFRAFGFRGPATFGGGDPTRIQRFENEEQERFEGPRAAAEAATFARLSPFARRGVAIQDEVKDRIFRFELERARRDTKLIQDLRNIGGHINKTSYNAAEHLNGK